MTARSWTPRPKAGDIVQCRFPEEKVGAPGQKDRPGLVVQVEQDPDDSSASIVLIAYGTSQDVANRYPGEFTVVASDAKAGLDKDTKFDLGSMVRLPFDCDWFAASPNRRFGAYPKRGALDLGDAKLKRALQAAIIEAKAAGRL